MKASRTLILALVALIVLPSAATARQPSGDAADPNDTHGLLDVSHIYGVKTVSNGPLTIRIDFFDQVRNSQFGKGSNDRVYVYFDAAPSFNQHADYTGIFLGTVSGKLIFQISGSGGAFEPLKVTRPNAKELKVIVPGGSPPNPNGPLEINVKTVYRTASGECSSGCQDRAPDTGWLLT